ncbi:MAG: hypothetical protein ABIP03_01710 [Aquihabitans sp.]
MSGEESVPAHEGRLIEGPTLPWGGELQVAVGGGYRLAAVNGSHLGTHQSAHRRATPIIEYRVDQGRQFGVAQFVGARRLLRQHEVVG